MDFYRILFIIRERGSFYETLILSFVEEKVAIWIGDGQFGAVVVVLVVGLSERERVVAAVGAKMMIANLN